MAGVWLARGCAAAFGRLLIFRFPFGSYSGPPLALIPVPLWLLFRSPFGSYSGPPFNSLFSALHRVGTAPRVVLLLLVGLALRANFPLSRFAPFARLCIEVGLALRANLAASASLIRQPLTAITQSG